MDEDPSGTYRVDESKKSKNHLVPTGSTVLQIQYKSSTPAIVADTRFNF